MESLLLDDAGHNPPDPAMNEIAERIVQLLIGRENRRFAKLKRLIAKFARDDASAAESLESVVVRDLQPHGYKGIVLFYRVLSELFGPSIEDRFRNISANDLEHFHASHADEEFARKIRHGMPAGGAGPSVFQFDNGKPASKDLRLDDCGGLLAEDISRIDSALDRPILDLGHWTRFESVLTVPNITFAGSATPPAAGGPTPISTDGYWVNRFSGGARNIPVRQFHASTLAGKELESVDMPVFVVPTVGRGNYYHSLINSAPALHWYSVLGLDCPIVMPACRDGGHPALRGIFDAAVRAMGIPQERVMSVYEAVGRVYRFAIMPSGMHREPETVSRIRERFMPSILSADEPAIAVPDRGEKVYISRRNAHRRSLINEDEVIKLVGHFGFSIVEMERLSLAEQVRTMAAARIVIAPHGAGLANMVFCKPGAHIVELVTEIKPHMARIAAAADHFYSPVLCDAQAEKTYTADLDRIRQVCEYLQET
jgi:hypothetical protein